MGRPKGSKNIVKESGNPDFNLNEVEPSQTIGRDVAASAVMPEDLELERTLASMISELPDIDDPEPIGSVVQKTKEKIEMLRNVVSEYQPAKNRQEILDQVHLAKVEGCDSIEATSDAIKTVCRDQGLESVGYFMYHDIRVYIDGHVEKSKARDRMTMEQRLHGGVTVQEKNRVLKDKIRALEDQIERE